VAYNFEENWLRYEGAAIPSSESLTARRYLPIRSIDICGDSLSRLRFMGDASRSRTDNFEARCLRYAGNGVRNLRLFMVSDVRSRKIFVMAGHEGGIVAFGKNFEDVFEVVTRERRGSSPCIEHGFHERNPSRHDG
jgi:hypothetical protein